MSCPQIVTSLSFLQFMANFEQSGSRISVKYLNFHEYLTKTEGRIKKISNAVVILLRSEKPLISPEILIFEN